MPDFLEALFNARRRGRVDKTPDPMTSGVIIGINGPRYLVNDGSNLIECESGVSTNLRVNDRVWLARGMGTFIIVGHSGANGTET